MYRIQPYKYNDNVPLIIMTIHKLELDLLSCFHAPHTCPMYSSKCYHKQNCFFLSGNTSHAQKWFRPLHRETSGHIFVLDPTLWCVLAGWCHDLSTPAFISMVTKSTLQVFNGFIHISLQHLWHGAGLVTVLYMALETSDNLSPTPCCVQSITLSQSWWGISKS